MMELTNRPRGQEVAHKSNVVMGKYKLHARPQTNFSLNSHREPTDVETNV